MEDALGFAAFGGLERLAIIAGALLVGYWGYRLYVDGKGAGLAFLGIACVVLFGALLTGGSHVRTVGESIQLASSRTAETNSTESADRLAQIEGAAIASATADPGIADIAPSAASGSTTASMHTAGSQNAAAPVQPATDTPPLPVESATEAPAEADREADADVAAANRAAGIEASQERLPTAQELGGRIVSVKSGNLSLEWSPTPVDQ